MATPSRYQRVGNVAVTPSDYDTVGFPVYIRLDGVDDWLVTTTITPGTDKAQVFAGVRKLSDASVACLCELSADPASNSGSFSVLAPATVGATYRFGSKGAAALSAAVTSASYPAPITNVLAGAGDITGDTQTLRVNGAEAASSTVDQGTGNYLAYPLYIGRRGGTTLPFNGQLYSLIVRFGANLPAGTIASTESWVNGKTGAY